MADKLFGTADTGLINAAYRAAMANVPADLSGVYDKVVKSHGDFMKQVSETAGKLFADVEKYDQEMKNTFQPIYAFTNGKIIVSPEIKHHLGTCHFNQAFKFGRLEGNFNLILSEYYSILSDWLGPSQLHFYLLEIFLFHCQFQKFFFRNIFF